MSETPKSMIDELAAWNDGNGIDLEAWVGCEGNFRLAVGYSTVFWPRFKEAGDLIVMDRCKTDENGNVEEFEDLTPLQLEALLNHLHVRDIQHYDCEDISADKLILLGTVLKEIYEAKLKWQFPDKPCVVHFHIPDDRDEFTDYQITFWQKKHED